MTAELDVRLVGPDDLDQYFDVRAQSFGVAATERAEWIEFVGSAPDIVGFGAFRTGRLLGAARVIPGGQYVYGRSVPMGGLAAVVVRPEARGQGVARRLLAASVVWMRERGIAISSLHPASTRAYRGAGWEIAGRAGRVAVPTRSFSTIRGEVAGAVEQLADADAGAIRACYAAHAPSVHGGVDRSPSFWRLHEHGGSTDGAFTYGVRGGDGLRGYVAFTQAPGAAAWGYSLHVDDVVAHDRETATALWRFVGGHSMQVERTTVTLAALADLLLLLDEQDALTHLENGWMHRIVDLPAAIAGRGYPAELAGSVTIRVHDALVPANEGTWTLRVEDTRGEATPADTADVALDVGALSALYIGGATVGSLVTAGRITGPADDVATLGALLGAPAPTMTDDF